jgi:bifunctional non-homologous end joining protein LigD
MKRRDDHARPLDEYDVLTDQPQSVKSGRTLEDLASNGQPAGRKHASSARPSAARSVARQTAASKGKSKREPEPGKTSTRNSSGAKPANLPGAVKAPLPREITVELATLAPQPPEGDQWLHEIKFDGYRLVAVVEHGKAKLITRRQQDWTQRYPEVAAACAAVPAQSAVLDGELVALLPSGVSSFQALQNAARPGGDARLVYIAFDLLYLDGYDLRRVPLIDRKQRLHELLHPNDTRDHTATILYSDHLEGKGAAFLRESCRLGLEGIISKRRDRPYVSGRTGDWIKTKCLGREELVIGGYTLSTADRRGIGALLVGYFDGGQLVYAGRVGTGFDTRTLHDLRQRLEAIQQDRSPFWEVPAKERGPRVKWVQPQLVAEVKFGAWTDAGLLRQPSYQGLREDKPAREVGRPASLALAKGGQTPPTDAGRRTAGSNESHQTPAGRRRKAASPVGPPLAGKLTHPERILYPEMGVTKLGLAQYYAQVAEWILPHLVDRPLSLLRCPAGQSAGKCFFQKHIGAGTSAALGRVLIQEKDGPEAYVYVRDLDGLLALVQMSVLEIHPWGAKRDNVDRPDRLTIDLDPGPEVEWPRVVAAARAVRDRLAEYDLASFVKTTGGKGLHVVVPIAPRRYDWDQAKQFCKHLAEQLAHDEPEAYTASMAKARRQGRIFVDYLRNDRGATAVAAYSTRARPGATVSVPLRWDELGANLRSDHFHVGNLPARLAALKRDPWDGIDTIRQGIPDIKR